MHKGLRASCTVRAEGCTLPFANLEAVKELKHIQWFGLHNRDMHEWLLGEFIDITPSYIYSSLHWNLPACFSLALCTYDIFTPNDYILELSTKNAHSVWMFHIYICVINDLQYTHLVLQSYLQTPRNEEKPEYWLWSCVIVANLHCNAYEQLNRRCLLQSPHGRTAHEKFQDYSNFEVSKASDILKINSNTKLVI